MERAVPFAGGDVPGRHRTAVEPARRGRLAVRDEQPPSRRRACGPGPSSGSHHATADPHQPMTGIDMALVAVAGDERQHVTADRDDFGGRQPSSRTNRHDVSPSKVNLLSAPRSVAPGSSRAAAGRSLHGPRRPRRRARCPVPRNPPATCRRPCRTPTHGRRPVRWYSLTPSPGMLATTATATPHSADVTPAVTRGFFAIVRSRPLRFWTATTFGPRLTKLGRLRPALPLVNTSQPDSGSRSPRRPSPAPARWPPARE